jgi:hypothetical protein
VAQQETLPLGIQNPCCPHEDGFASLHRYSADVDAELLSMLVRVGVYEKQGIQVEERLDSNWIRRQY